MRAARVALAAVMLLAACSEKPGFRNTDLTGASYPKGFSLVDHDGVKTVLDTLGPARDEVQVLFVSVDPERDTPELLKSYVSAFDPGFLGLTGTPEAVAAVAKDFKVFYEKVPGKTDPSKYTINHTAGTYVFDRQGRIRLFVSHARGPENLIGDLKLLLAESR